MYYSSFLILAISVFVVQLLNFNTVLARPREVSTEPEFLYEPNASLPSQPLHEKCKNVFGSEKNTESGSIVVNGEVSCTTDTDVTESDNKLGHKKITTHERSNYYDFNGTITSRSSDENGSSDFKLNNETEKNNTITGTATEQSLPNGIVKTQHVEGEETYDEGTNAENSFHSVDNGITKTGSNTIDQFVSHFIREMSTIVSEKLNMPHSKTEIKQGKTHLQNSNYNTIGNDMVLNKKGPNLQTETKSTKSGWVGTRQNINQNTGEIVHEDELSKLKIGELNSFEKTFHSSTNEEDVNMFTNDLAGNIEITENRKIKEDIINHSKRGSKLTLEKTLKTNPKIDPLKMTFETKGLETEDRTEEMKTFTSIKKKGAPDVELATQSEVKHAYDTTCVNGVNKEQKKCIPQTQSDSSQDIDS